MSKRTCPRCGAEVQEKELFCSQCGEELTKECPHCGKKVAFDALFCMECGYSFQETEEEHKGPEPKEETPKQKTSEKIPAYKKWWFWAVLLAAAVILAVLISGDRSGRNSSSGTEINAEAGKSAAMEIEEFRDSINEAMEEIYGEDHYETQLDPAKKMLYIYVWMDNVTTALDQARTGDEEVVQDWNALVGLLLESCGAIRDQMDEQGLDDWSVSLNLLDEETMSEVYVITKDGDIAYDILADGETE